DLSDETSFLPSFPPTWWIIRASGLYSRSKLTHKIPAPVQPASNGHEASSPEEIGILPFFSDELRLDIDGRYPQNTVSGVLKLGFARCHWIAKLRYYGKNTWRGYIWYKRGSTHLLPQTHVKILVSKSFFTSQRKAYVTFYGSGLPTQVAQYQWKSAYFHEVNFEHDYAANASLQTTYDTGSHPNRPASLPVEQLTVKKVYQRAGFNVAESGTSKVPLTGAGPNAKWSDMEMHDAMQTYWSRFSNNAQWAMWVFFASLHEQGTSLGGVMFDTIGANERQGTAIFCDSFINNAPIGDPSPAAWRQRMKFWTTVHEMGHAFNLAHSWQKELVWNGYGPWIPLQDDNEARSFMNYPFNVQGGQQKFFEDFEFRFIDSEYLFLRHAPYEFVQPGNKAFFDHHGLEDLGIEVGNTLQLELRVHRDANHFEFMEPVRVEAKLKNTSSQPMLIPKHTFDSFHDLTVVIKKKDGTIKRWAPFARKLFEPTMQVLQPGQAIYGSVPVGNGLNGWDMSEPGYYEIKAMLEVSGLHYISNTLQIRIAPPVSHEQEYWAQDYFSAEVARIMYFDGSKYLQKGNDTLREVVDRFEKQSVARHARLALTKPLMKAYKELRIPIEVSEVPMSAAEAGGWIEETKPDPETVRTEMAKVLLRDQKESVVTFGHLDYEKQMMDYGTFLYENGDPKDATDIVRSLHDTMADRNVIKSALARIDQKADTFEKAAANAKSSRSSRRKSSKKTSKV
ncbi:MAG: hypothetical protein HKN76_18725, partial [Saprospiraceae bacterium]|nr:hypothetical protein [Saprospiraceae bacterium]